MTLEKRYYRALVVSSSDKFNEFIIPLLTAAGCESLTYANSISHAKRCSLENQFDFVVINAPLPDDSGSKYAIDISSDKSTICLIFLRAEVYPEIRGKVAPYGVFTLSKPTSATVVTNTLDLLLSARERLRMLEKKTLSIAEKMEEISLVNRAKWLLIDRLNMAEPDAHRYIEKQAMNTCVTKSEIAKEIIKTYS